MKYICIPVSKLNFGFNITNQAQNFADLLLSQVRFIRSNLNAPYYLYSGPVEIDCEHDFWYQMSMKLYKTQEVFFVN